MRLKGLFVGITTVDLHYLLDVFPAANVKRNAERFGLSTGGPATNAAVAFAALGGRSCLCTAVGEHAFTGFMRQELEGLGVELMDLAPDAQELPPFSSILTTKGSGERAVVAYTAGRETAADAGLPDVDMGDFDILLLDGFQMEVGRRLAGQAREQGIPVVLDGGSWKPGMELLLKYVDIAICSADFRPPGSGAGSEPREVLDYLSARGVRHVAVTRGEKAVVYYDGDRFGEVPVEPVQVVDTLGAGDIFHGAFCYHFARLNDFEVALAEAARVAGRSCGFFGTREWINGN